MVTHTVTHLRFTAVRYHGPLKDPWYDGSPAGFDLVHFYTSLRAGMIYVSLSSIDWVSTPGIGTRPG
jgi:hypothetical protein